MYFGKFMGEVTIIERRLGVSQHRQKLGGLKGPEGAGGSEQVAAEAKVRVKP